MPRECKNGFINSYIEYTRPQESPTLFHSWTAISTIASALRRRVWIDRGFYTLYPNLYTILVSDSGVGRKSTAIKIGTESLLRKAVPDITIMRGKLTMGYLVDWMTQAQAKNPEKVAEVTVHCSEFKVFSKGAYSDSGLIEDLTDLYDGGRFEYRTKNAGVFIIEKPCINIIAASTPEWLTIGSAADFIGGGFSSRIVPVALVKEERRNAWPLKGQMEKALEENLIADLAVIGQLKGQFLVTTGGIKRYKEWYDVREKFFKPDIRLKGYFSKKHDLVLKIAMILSAGVNDDMVIHEDHIDSSLKILGKMEENIAFAFSGAAWGGEEVRFQDKVWLKIQSCYPGEIAHSDLLQCFHTHMTGKDLISIIKTLLAEDRIETPRREVTEGRTKLIYKAKEEKKG
jgi:hypothetical protein